MSRYQIYFDYSNISTERSSKVILINSNIDGCQLIRAECNTELNNAGSLNFTVPKNHIHYNTIEYNLFLSTIKVFEVNGNDRYMIFVGRPIQSATDYFGNLQVSCEGALAYFNDTIQRPFTVYPSENDIPEEPIVPTYGNKNIKWFINKLVDNHNKVYGYAKHEGNYYYSFYTGTNKKGAYKRVFNSSGQTDQLQFSVYVSDDILAMNAAADDEDDEVVEPAKDQLKKIYREVKYETTMNAISSYCVDTVGGYLYIDQNPAPSISDYLRLRWVKYPWDIWGDVTQNQPISYMANMTDINKSVDATEIYTRLIPIGGNNKKGKAVTIKSVNDGDDWIANSSFESQYGVIETTQQFSDCTTPKKLLKKARKWLEKEQFNMMTLEVSALDLSYDDPNFNVPFMLGQKVKVILPWSSSVSSRYVDLPISKIEYNLLTGEKNITLGNIQKKRLSEIKMEDSGVNKNGKKTDEQETFTKDDLTTLYIGDDGNHRTWYADETTDPITGITYVGWDTVEVNVTTTGTGALVDHTFRENGTFNVSSLYPDDNYYGFANVTVDVHGSSPTPDPYTFSETLIVHNATHTDPGNGYELFANDPYYVYNGTIGENVQNCYRMFYNCQMLNNIVSINFGNNMNNCAEMFRYCGNINVFTSKAYYSVDPFPNSITNTFSMFSDCSNLLGLGPVINKESKLDDCSRMFYNCVNMTGYTTYVYRPDLDVGEHPYPYKSYKMEHNIFYIVIPDNVTNCAEMFSRTKLGYYSCNVESTSGFGIYIGKNVANCYHMFSPTIVDGSRSNNVDNASADAPHIFSEYPDYTNMGFAKFFFAGTPYNVEGFLPFRQPYAPDYTIGGDTNYWSDYPWRDTIIYCNDPAPFLEQNIIYGRSIRYNDDGNGRYSNNNYDIFIYSGYHFDMNDLNTNGPL